MNKKITELMDELDETFIEDIELEENQLDGERLSLERIKAKAMEEIKATPLETKRSKKKSGLRIKKRIWIPLVAALTAIGISVVAVSNNPVLSELIGDKFGMVQEEAQVVGKSVVKRGIIFTVEEAVIDSSSGFIALSFAKEDGTPFEEGTMPKRISINPKNPTSMGWGYESILSEDGKKIFCLIDINMSKNLYGQEIEIIAEGLVSLEHGQVPLEVNLQEAYNKMEEIDYTYYEGLGYKKEQALGLLLTEQLPELVLDQVVLDHKGIFKLYTSYLDPDDNNYLDTRFKLIDTKANVEIYYQGGTNIWDGVEKRRKIEDIFRGVLEEDLPHLQLELEYEKYVPVMEEDLSLTFRLQKNKNVKKVKPNVVVTSGDNEVRIKEVEVSRLGVRVEGSMLKGSVGILDLSLKRKDGSKVKLTSSGLNTKMNYFFIWHLKATDEEVQMPSSEVDNLGQDSISHSIGSHVQEFINLEEVESLVVEDVEIPLK